MGSGELVRAPPADTSLVSAPCQALLWAQGFPPGVRQSPYPQGVYGLMRQQTRDCDVMSVIGDTGTDRQGKGRRVLLHRGSREGPSEGVASEQSPEGLGGQCPWWGNSTCRGPAQEQAQRVGGVARTPMHFAGSRWGWRAGQGPGLTGLAGHGKELGSGRERARCGRAVSTTGLNLKFSAFFSVWRRDGGQGDGQAVSGVWVGVPTRLPLPEMLEGGTDLQITHTSAQVGYKPVVSTSSGLVICYKGSEFGKTCLLVYYQGYK